MVKTRRKMTVFCHRCSLCKTVTGMHKWILLQIRFQIQQWSSYRAGMESVKPYGNSLTTLRKNTWFVQSRLKNVSQTTTEATITHLYLKRMSMNLRRNMTQRRIIRSWTNHRMATNTTKKERRVGQSTQRFIKSISYRYYHQDQMEQTRIKEASSWTLTKRKKKSMLWIKTRKTTPEMKSF